MTSNFIPRSEAAKLADTTVNYLEKLMKAGELEARYYMKGQLKKWEINIECERFQRLLNRKKTKDDPRPEQQIVRLDWQEWERMLINGDSLVRNECTQATIKGYKNFIKMFFNKHPALNRDTLSQFMSFYNNKKTGEKDYFRTKLLTYYALMTVAKYYVFKGYENKNFIESLEALRPKKGIKKVSRPTYTVEVINTALKRINEGITKRNNSIYNQYDKVLNSALLQVMFHMAIRASELVNIHLKDINWEEQTVLIKGKGRKHRTLAFNRKIKDELLSLWHIRPHTFVPNFFVCKEGKPLTTDALGRKLRRMGKAREIQELLKGQRFNPHGTRRTALTEKLLDPKWTPIEVRDIAGHSNLSTTNIYANPHRERILSKMKED